MARIAVLGSGVIGCSVALAARAAGHEVRLIGARRMTDRDAQSSPFFASAYPVASIVPHHIPGHGLEAMFDDSNDVYEALTQDPDAGVRPQRHLELFENPEHVVEPLVRLREIEPVSADRSPGIPRRRGAESVTGFAFSCFFCNMPIYAAWLDRKIDEAPIAFERRRLDAASAFSADADITINCLGSGSSRVFPELGAGIVYRGILLRAPFEQPPGEIVSYNYTPELSVYREDDDTPTDLYFFPRDGHCMLGGTRQLGRIRQEDRAFVPASPSPYETIEIDGIDVPRVMIDVNRELIEQLTGRLPSEHHRAVVGYRHLAGDPAAPRLVIGAREGCSGPSIVDCYGFGGAGVTLSWGAALKTMRIVQSVLDGASSTNETPRAASLARTLVAERR